MGTHIRGRESTPSSAAHASRPYLPPDKMSSHLETHAEADTLDVGSIGIDSVLAIQSVAGLFSRDRFRLDWHVAIAGICGGQHTARHLRWWVGSVLGSVLGCGDECGDARGDECGVECEGGCGDTGGANVDTVVGIEMDAQVDTRANAGMDLGLGTPLACAMSQGW
jgi:hypothetical protein